MLTRDPGHDLLPRPDLLAVVCLATAVLSVSTLVAVGALLLHVVRLRKAVALKA